jgi:hypothetical protein
MAVGIRGIASVYSGFLMAGTGLGALVDLSGGVVCWKSWRRPDWSSLVGSRNGSGHPLPAEV